VNIKTIRKIGYSTIAALLLTGTLFASPPSSGQSTTVRVDASAWNFQQEASDLLTQVQMLSDKLSVDSDRLASFTHSKLSWESHATQLHLVRDHINQIGEKLARLQEIRHVTSPWQQRAIDRVVPVAATLAAHTQAAIEHLNENQGHLFAPSYQAHLEAIAERADTMNTILDKFLDLGNAQQRLERLQQETEMLES
jgi:hypothetical protein